MITILGFHISSIRPSLNHQCRVYKDELPYVRYRKPPKVNKENSGKVAFVCVKLKSGGVRGIRKGTHVDVCETFGVDPDNVAEVGWILEGEKKVWR